MHTTDDNGNTWSQQQILVAADRQPNDHMGLRVALYNNTIVAGAWYDNNDNGNYAGA